MNGMTPVVMVLLQYDHLLDGNHRRRDFAVTNHAIMVAAQRGFVGVTALLLNNHPERIPEEKYICRLM